MTTFLVTNGCFPEKLQLRTLPTQLYVSLCSNSKAMLQKVQKPVIPNAWERLVKTLKLLPSLKTRKVIRLTMVKNLNMLRPGRYAQLISMAAPDFIEVKAFMPVGWARERLPYGVMPRHAEIKAFAEEIARETSYEIVNEKADSRVVLLKA
jgi:tRNA wybutosine-synthesizing protein 1